MARKKAEIQLLREIETQEEWEEVMAMEGLWVVDVYQEWCGPCQALVGHFRRLKNEMGDAMLNFAMAKADTIDALEKYRGRCEPTFLFFAGGILTSYIHGADAPKVQKVITEQLASEHKILEGTGERKEVKDPVITRAEELQYERLAEEEAEKLLEAAKYETKPKDITVAIIKPDAVAQGKVEEIIAEIKENGIEVLAKEDRELTHEEALKLYSNLQNETYFDDLIKFITSGPSCILILARGDLQMTIVKDWRDLIGPNNVEQAKEEAPATLRARYGEKAYLNAVHGSSSKEAAARELAFFFPNYKLPLVRRKKVNIQRTLALIRPEAFATKSDAILQKISEAGFKIAMIREVQLSKEQAAEFYKEHEQYAYFDSLVENMSSGPLLALGLARDDAIKAWRNTLGPANIDEAIEKAPQSLRAQFQGSSGMNQFHGSDSEKAAKEELAYFFPMEQTLAVIKPDAMVTKDEIIAKIHEAGFRIAARQETMITENVAQILYPKHTFEDYYEDLVNFMTSGPTLFMVLSREGAVSGWRQEIGPVDPEAAKNQNRDFLRAEYGKDILHNAVHGSSNIAHAKREIKAIFGDLKFNEDGTIKGFEPDLEETSQVLDRDRTSDAGEDGPEYDESGDRDTAAQDVLRGETQHDDEANDGGLENTEKPHTPERDTDDKAEDGGKDRAQVDEQAELAEEHQVEADVQEMNGTHRRPGSSHDPAEADDGRHQDSSDGEADKDRQLEHQKSTQEPRGSDEDIHGKEAGSHDEAEKEDQNEHGKETARHDTQGSHHSLEKVEAPQQDSGHHGQNDDNNHNQKSIEEAHDEAEEEVVAETEN